ncbi:BatD family protein [Haloferula sargassicola]|uniref:SH3b domain-containing protein n=1 Tax=Haloferula sargassicola TaxID=490096 RepID=A0ABP9UV30_9BACT
MIRHFTLLLLLWTLQSATSLAEPVTSRLSSHFLVRGEEAELEYRLPSGVSPRSSIEAPVVDGLVLQQIGYSALPVRGSFGRRDEYAFRFRLASYTPGDYTIPSTTIDTGNGIINTEPVTLRVAHETELEWKTVTAGVGQFRYSAAFRTLDDAPYVNEVIPVELKLYVPASQNIEDWGVPEFERDGVAAWRFEPRPQVGRVELAGGRYFAVSYPSTLSPLRDGRVTLGPAKLRLITVQTAPNRFSSSYYQPVNLEVDGIALQARPLPKDAPEGFANAVGQFDLSVTAQETEVREGDPVTLSLTVSGSGNLDTLEPPELIDDEGWKSYPPSRIESPERREMSGITVFRQFLRPERLAEEVPPFRFVYFDPEAEEYRQLLSVAIPLQVVPSTSSPTQGSMVPPAQPVPLEEMTDILGIIPNAGGHGSLWGLASRPWWQLVPLALAILLLIRIVQIRLAPKMRTDPDKQARRQALREVSAAGKDPKSFYRRAGAFIEKWLGDSDSPLTREVLVRRDEICFTKDVPSSALPSGERQRILRGLRKLALPVLLAIAALGLVHPVRAAETEEPDSAEEAYHDSRYAEAADLWLQSAPWDRLPAGTLYNIGNAAYRLGAPGQAALYWRRANLKAGSHPESQQNLRFLERKFGSISIRRPDYQYALAKVSKSTWENSLWVGAWLGVLGLLVFPATRPGARLRVAGIAALAGAPLVAAIGWLGLHYYPDDARFADVRSQGVIIVDRADIRTDAARNAPLVIEAPAGSLCRMLQTAGDWTYVAFTNDTRGWVPSDQMEAVVVDERPDPPHRPDAESDTGKSA